MEGLAELVEGLVVHVEHAMHLTDDVEEMRVAALGEVELLQVSVFLKEVGLGDMFGDFQARHQARLPEEVRLPEKIQLHQEQRCTLPAHHRRGALRAAYVR